MTTSHDASCPLCVDLDGTLVDGDLLMQAAAEAMRSRPVRFVAAGLSLLRGKAAFKSAVARAVPIDPETLDYRDSVLALMAEHRAGGGEVVLATAADESIAQAVAAHVGGFSAVIASDGTRNLRGEAKAVALAAAYPDGFDYVGDSEVDLPIWRAARHAYAVPGPGADHAKSAEIDVTIVGEPEPEVPDHADASSSSSLPPRLRLLRPHQWVKNTLIVIPFLASHQSPQVWDVVALAVMFACFCLAASAGYVINDLLDLSSDRRHPHKRHRPLASGAVTFDTGLRIGIACFLISQIAAWTLLPWQAAVALSLYQCATVSYSTWLKRLLLVDVITLAGLYTLRIYGGGMAVNVEPSFWLLSFSMAVFLSLAFAKRFAELDAQERESRGTNRARGYDAPDIPMVRTFGVACGIAAVLVMGIYINDSEVASDHYPTRLALWASCPLLFYWIARLWFIAGRGRLDEDPVVFTFRDRTSVVTGLLIVLSFVIASFSFGGAAG